MAFAATPGARARLEPRVLIAARGRLARLLTWRRTRAYALVLVAVYVVAYVDVLALGNLPLNSGGEPVAGDYIAFHTAARLITSGHAAQMYDHAPIVAIQDEMLHGVVPGFYDAYRNPPFYALIYAPLAGLDVLWGFGAWAVVSLCSLGLAIKLLLDEVPGLRRRWAGVLIFAFAFAPVYFGLIDGENATVSLCSSRNCSSCSRWCFSSRAAGDLSRPTRSPR
jgi:hypothetical protein